MTLALFWGMGGGGFLERLGGGGGGARLAELLAFDVAGLLARSP